MGQKELAQWRRGFGLREPVRQVQYPADPSNLRIYETSLHSNASLAARRSIISLFSVVLVDFVTTEMRLGLSVSKRTGRSPQRISRRSCRSMTDTSNASARPKISAPRTAIKTLRAFLLAKGMIPSRPVLSPSWITYPICEVPSRLHANDASL